MQTSPAHPEPTPASLCSWSSQSTSQKSSQPGSARSEQGCQPRPSNTLSYTAVPFFAPLPKLQAQPPAAQQQQQQHTAPVRSLSLDAVPWPCELSHSSTAAASQPCPLKQQPLPAQPALTRFDARADTVAPSDQVPFPHIAAPVAFHLQQKPCLAGGGMKDAAAQGAGQGGTQDTVSGSAALMRNNSCACNALPPSAALVPPAAVPTPPPCQPTHPQLAGQAARPALSMDDALAQAVMPSVDAQQGHAMGHSRPAFSHGRAASLGSGFPASAGMAMGPVGAIPNPASGGRLASFPPAASAGMGAGLPSQPNHHLLKQQQAQAARNYAQALAALEAARSQVCFCGTLGLLHFACADGCLSLQQVDSCCPGYAVQRVPNIVLPRSSKIIDKMVRRLSASKEHW